MEISKPLIFCQILVFKICQFYLNENFTLHRYLRKYGRIFTLCCFYKPWIIYDNWETFIKKSLITTSNFQNECTWTKTYLYDVIDQNYEFSVDVNEKLQLFFEKGLYLCWGLSWKGVERSLLELCSGPSSTSTLNPNSSNSSSLQPELVEAPSPNISDLRSDE